ncbi:MAG: MarR family winged helix-turn-helix transcriptional regulator [Terriglobia bacterium]
MRETAPLVTGTLELPCACASLRRATRVVTQLYDEELRGAGLRATQFTLLQALERAGRITQGRLGELLAIDSTTLTRTLRLLIGKGWVRSVPGQDRRERHLQLTPAGRREFDQARPHWERAQHRLRLALGDSLWKLMQTALVRMAEAARQA